MNSWQSLSSSSVVTPGPTCGDDHVEGFGGQPAGAAHAVESLGPVPRHLGLAGRASGGGDLIVHHDEGDHRSMEPPAAVRPAGSPSTVTVHARHQASTPASLARPAARA